MLGISATTKIWHKSLFVIALIGQRRTDWQRAKSKKLRKFLKMMTRKEPFLLMSSALPAVGVSRRCPVARPTYGVSKGVSLLMRQHSMMIYLNCLRLRWHCLCGVGRCTLSARTTVWIIRLTNWSVTYKQVKNRTACTPSPLMMLSVTGFINVFVYASVVDGHRKLKTIGWLKSALLTVMPPRKSWTAFRVTRAACG